ncbi:MAG: hypothetical protein AB1384_13040 [Actinomycetota bacterium]
MQMLEPDFWKGRGRYSKQALSRRIVDEKPIHLPDIRPEKAADGS